MKQLVQVLKSGEMTVQDFPVPVVSAGEVLVKNHYSVISAGTEGASVVTARKSLLGKAKERPQQVGQVVDSLRKQGPVQTYRAVMKRLDAYTPLGYSTAGEVIDVGSGVTGFSIGDMVACAGAGYANHAEVVTVPVNLCVKLPADADLKSASYNTIGAIAMQGVRQADLRLGESCAVIGLGLIGQLTCSLLKASGVNSYGIDIDTHVVEIAKKHCADEAWIRSDSGITDQIMSLTDGLGVDAVIITAQSSSLDPINFAGEIVRKKGRVIVVGAVPTGFARDPFYYRKEIDVRMSCSYGPGRYDPEYEEKGVDYPAAYVRWTEKRNMLAFQNMLHSKRIDIGYLTTHEFTLDDAPGAYNMIVGRTEPFMGIVIQYDPSNVLLNRRVDVMRWQSDGGHAPADSVRIGFVGVGSYAQGNLLPNIPQNDNGIVCVGVLDANGAASKKAAEKYGFKFCTSDTEAIFGSDDINTVFIATRHDSHAEYVIRGLEADKHVFVEKPLCLTETELDEIEALYYKKNAEEKQRLHLMIGFNRRFSPLTTDLKNRLSKSPMSMIYRVNSGAIPADNWIQDVTVGGGRILGEACHFIDYLSFMCDALPVRVYASAMTTPGNLNDTVVINLEFSDGSIGAVSYYANGSKQLPKEYIEVHQSGFTGVLSDFKELKMYGGKKPKRKKMLNQDKGQFSMVNEYLRRIRAGEEPLIAPDEVFGVMRATFAVLTSLRTGKAVSL